MNFNPRQMDVTREENRWHFKLRIQYMLHSYLVVLIISPAKYYPYPKEKVMNQLVVTSHTEGKWIIYKYIIEQILVYTSDLRSGRRDR